MQAQDLGNEERWPCRSLGSEPPSRARELERQVRLQLGCFGTGQEQGKRDEGARQVRSGRRGRPPIRAFTLRSTTRMSSLDLCTPAMEALDGFRGEKNLVGAKFSSAEHREMLEA